MAQTALYEYGKKLVDLYKHNRHYFFLPDDDIENIQNIQNIIQKHVSIDLSIFNYQLVKRTSETGFYMKWHIDDMAVIKTNKENKENTFLDGKYMLYHKHNLPVYTAIIYLSEHNKDFLGGEFEFVDQQIKPKRNFILFFDSREVHRVLPIKSGNRDTIVIKFYENK